MDAPSMRLPESAGTRPHESSSANRLCEFQDKMGAERVTWWQMKGHGAKFSRKKDEAIAALLSQRNVEEAARTIGIGANTLLRWMQVPEFQVAYRAARRDAYLQSI